MQGCKRIERCLTRA